MKYSFLAAVAVDYHKRSKLVYDQVLSVRYVVTTKEMQTVGYDARILFVLLLNTAQFEFLLKEVWMSAMHLILYRY